MANWFEEEVEAPEMETLAALAENVVYRVPGCSDMMVRKALQETYRDFCRRSCCLCGRRRFALEVGQDSFAVSARFGGAVDSVAEITICGRRLSSPRDYFVTDGLTPTVKLATHLVVPEGTPTTSLPTVEVLAVEMPLMNSEEMPSWFAQRYGEAIVSGALGRLMTMNGKPWADAAAAQVERLAYENAVCAARLKYYAGGANGAGSLGTAISDNLV